MSDLTDLTVDDIRTEVDRSITQLRLLERIAISFETLTRLLGNPIVQIMPTELETAQQLELKLMAAEKQTEKEKD